MDLLISILVFWFVCGVGVALYLLVRYHKYLTLFTSVYIIVMYGICGIYGMFRLLDEEHNNIVGKILKEYKDIVQPK